MYYIFLLMKGISHIFFCTFPILHPCFDFTLPYYYNNAILSKRRLLTNGISGSSRKNCVVFFPLLSPCTNCASRSEAAARQRKEKTALFSFRCSRLALTLQHKSPLKKWRIHSISPLKKWYKPDKSPLKKWKCYKERLTISSENGKPKKTRSPLSSKAVGNAERLFPSGKTFFRKIL